jgi:hypothetical protein
MGNCITLDNFESERAVNPGSSYDTLHLRWNSSSGQFLYDDSPNDVLNKLGKWRIETLLGNLSQIENYNIEKWWEDNKMVYYCGVLCTCWCWAMHYAYCYARNKLEEVIRKRAFCIKTRLDDWGKSYDAEGLDLDCESSPLGA